LICIVSSQPLNTTCVEAGALMNKYDELGVAGEGAYGVVLKCKDKATGELVAIKKFRELDEDDEEAKRFTQREVKILKSLKHEHIIQMKEVFRKKGVLHLVFEYVDRCLLDLLEASPSGLGAETKSLTRQLTKALEHCHGHNIIHRDLKPDNLLISSADRCLKLCDFGSARKLGSAPSSAVLTDYVATRWYRAPELLVRSNDYDKAADVWALGCVMVEMTTGRPLFAGKSDIDQLHLIHKALGPLTAHQMRNCMELSNAREINFPAGAAPVGTLRKWYGNAMPAEQLQLLECLIVIDPGIRYTAKAALASAWLNEATGRSVVSGQSSLLPPRPEASTAVVSRPSSRQLAPPPAAQKPRVRKSPSPSPQAPSRTPRGYEAAPVVGIAVAPRHVEPPPRVETPPPEVEAEMVESMAELVESLEEDLRPARSRGSPGDASTVSDAMEESIPEEIHTPRPSQDDDGLRSGPPSRASSRPPSVGMNPRARSSPPPFRVTPQPVGLVRKTRPASSVKAPSSHLRRE